MQMYDVYKEIAKLRKKHGKDRSSIRKFPNYKIEQNVAPCSDRFVPGTAARKKENKPPEHLIVDILHKQGPMVISREDLKYSGGKKV